MRITLWAEDAAHSHLLILIF